VSAVAGVWLVDKPAGPTSHDVVAAVRRRLGRGVKVGHAGTLDPFATGLLLILTGRATRLAPFLTALDKTYVATVRLGATSATGDPEGPVTVSGHPAPADRVEGVLSTFRGRRRQRVPAFSAVKVGGERLYRRARRGEEVEAPEREVVIHGIEMLGYDRSTGRLRLEVRCGKGTYMRQLAVDIGESLGCGGYCEELRRTAVGHMGTAAAVAAEDVDRGPGVGIRTALSEMPVRELDPSGALAVLHGRSVPGEAAGPVLLVRGDDVLAVARPGAPGMLHPSLVLAEPQEESVGAEGTSPG
jgi:tRNA pseudouridine55 synthase